MTVNLINPYRFGQVAPTIVASSEGGGSGTSNTVPVPTGTANGDIMVTFICGGAPGNAGPPAPTPAAGWTALITDVGPTAFVAVYYRVASSEPASYVWLSPASGRRYLCTTVRGASGIANAGAAFGEQENASSTDVTAPSIDTGSDTNCLLLFGGRNNALANWTAPAGFTTLIQSPTSGTAPAHLSYGTQAAAGATGTKVATTDAAAINHGVLIAFKP